jgi:hypothetical protein
MKISLKTSVELYKEFASVPPFVTSGHRKKPAARLRLVPSFRIHGTYIQVLTHSDDEDKFEGVNVGDHCISFDDGDDIFLWTLAVNCSE